ncbi:hypothetical protein Q7C36_004231 [Tachysurus vachellii]|uniref:Uncharacterized protein n=1 Tax=Tachysurus vachellii TaxID=175792 RepID=A0AA88NN16_TACVA|nr:hypothetical protein Q7C36_004231 [Tachysurus vachellii]
MRNILIHMEELQKKQDQPLGFSERRDPHQDRCDFLVKIHKEVTLQLTENKNKERKNIKNVS